MAQDSPKYEIFKIISADGKNEVDFAKAQFRVGNIYYYENILSPFITGVVTISSTSKAAKSPSSVDVQNRFASLHSGLPLEVGCQILMKIKNSIGSGINFSSTTNDHKRFYVNEVQVLSKSSKSEIIQLRFISKIGWSNNTKRITRHFAGSITESIKSILKKELKLKNDMISVDDSSNSYSFAGMTKRPFDLIVMLAKQTIPKNTANPGYFAYETKTGFKYLSVDSLVNKKPYKKNYFYSSIIKGSQQSRSNKDNFKIASLTVVKDQNLTSQIRSGVYGNKTIFFNPATYGFTEIDITVDNDKLFKDPKFSTLGKKPGVPKILEDDFGSGNKFHRVQTAVLNIGGNEENINPNNNPEFYYAAGTTRYNLLFSQQHAITIPGNTDLEAGDVLRLDIENIGDAKEEGPDQKQSGNYIIQGLCHYFDPEASTTSLLLVRDSYGLHSSKNS